jgi:hypothetical protein
VNADLAPPPLALTTSPPDQERDVFVPLSSPRNTTSVGIHSFLNLHQKHGKGLLLCCPPLLWIHGGTSHSGDVPSFSFLSCLFCSDKPFSQQFVFALFRGSLRTPASASVPFSLLIPDRVGSSFPVGRYLS